MYLTYEVHRKNNYEKSFGMKPKEYTSPLEKGDYPELDTSKLCTMEQVAQYQSMIRSLQWIVTIGRTYMQQ
jgi:hypothetical protein